MCPLQFGDATSAKPLTHWDTASILRDSNEVHQEALDQLRSPNLDRSVQHVEDLVRLHTDALARNIEVLQAIDARGTRRSPTSGSRSRCSSRRASSPPHQVDWNTTDDDVAS